MQEKLLRYMIDSEIIDPEDQVIYRYGMQQLKGSLISIGTTLLIGILFHAVWASICFAAAYIPLRSFAGGISCQDARDVLSVVNLVDCRRRMACQKCAV